MNNFDKLLAGIVTPTPEVPRTDDMSGPVHQIKVGTTWHVVDGATWRSWTGERRINGDDVHAPVYTYLAPEGTPPYAGKRECSCKVCQATVAPAFRPN